MLQFIADIQHSFLSGGNPRENFSKLLAGLLEFTESEYGFIGEVNQLPGADPYLKTHAITDLSWDKATKEFHDANINSGLEFYNLDTLFGYCIKTGEVVIANDARNDERAGGIPEGHPPLNSFLGLPLFMEDKLVGMAGVANRPGGYDEELLAKIDPLVATVAALIHSHKLASRLDGLLKSQVAILNTTLEGICGVDIKGRITFANTMAIDLLGRPEDELIGQQFHDLVCRWDKEGKPQSWQESVLHTTLKSGMTIEVSDGLFFTGNGTHLAVDYSTVAIKGETGIDGAVVSFKDISKRKFAERQMMIAKAKEERAIQIQRKEMQRLSKLVENSPMCIHEIGLDGKLLSMNPSGLAMMGATEESEIQGLQYLDIPCKNDQLEVRRLFAAALEGETAFFDFAADTGSGIAYFSSCFVPIEDNDQITMIMGITEDITAFKEAELEIKKREKRLRAIIDSVPSMIFVKDAKGRYLEANQAAADSIGMPVKEVIGKTGVEIHGQNEELAEDTPNHDQHVLDTGEELIVEVDDFETGTGEHKHIQIIKRRAADEIFNEPAVVANVIDITDLKNTERELTAAMDKAQEASKAKSEFLSSVSHELRTPLNAVMGHAQLMQFDDLSDEHQMHTDQIVSAAKKLTQHIDALLFFGKAAQRKPGEVKPIALIDLFEMLRLQLKPAIITKQLTFSCELPDDTAVNAVEADMEELFTNIVANAVKYNRQGGSVLISLAGRGENSLQVSVKDTGLGFPAGVGDKIFEPFERLDQRNSTIEGTGLGLAIAKEAAERLGATICFDSTEGEGSEFIVEIPLNQSDNKRNETTVGGRKNAG